MTWKLVDYNGRLAITLDWSPDNSEPIERRDLWIHPTEKWDVYYEQFVEIHLIENGYFTCFSKNTYTSKPLYTNGWEHVMEERPVKQPSRGGKDWKWEWRWGRWVKGWK